MKLLILQHARVEHPGSFRNFLREDGHDCIAVELDEGEALPALDGFDALWVMGGPMDVWEEDEYPWLREEKALIREAVEGRGMPFFGLCLGHQLLAEALGGSCGVLEQPEIGVMPVQLTEAGATSIILDDLPDMFDCLQWHSVEVKTMPAGAICLATSPACAVQDLAAVELGPPCARDTVIENCSALARFVTESIIELFETINIEHEDCEFMSEFASIFDG